MILTITPNPTIDRVLFVRNFAMQDVVRADREVISPSGKGIDVAIMLHKMGLTTQAIGLRAGRHGEWLAQQVADQGVAADWIEARGETRVATLLTDTALGRQSTIMPHTLHAEPQHLEQILARIDLHAADGWGLISAGSLPPGLPTDAHRQIVACAKAHGLITLLDSAGPPLFAGIQARPHILKLNLAEFLTLAAATRAPSAADVSASQAAHASTMGEGIEPGESLSRNGLHPGGLGGRDSAADGVGKDEWWTDDGGLDYWVERVETGGMESLLQLAEQLEPHLDSWAEDAIIVTLGRNGILAVTQTGIYHAPALPVDVVSPAGAGDAVSAGILLARSQGEEWQTALIWAAALAASSVTHAETSGCDRAQVLALAEEAMVIELDGPHTD